MRIMLDTAILENIDILITGNKDLRVAEAEYPTDYGNKWIYRKILDQKKKNSSIDPGNVSIPRILIHNIPPLQQLP